jgi:threonine dehydratase
LRLTDAIEARRRIAPYIRRTPLIPSAWLGDLTGTPVSLKLESLQVSNSFKSRGAFNAVIARLERQPASGLRLVTASAGNHGRGLAAAAECFGLPLVVFTPGDAPRAKLDAIRRHRADLRAVGKDYDDAEGLAKTYAKETGAEFISPYNDFDVVAGAATIALEIFEDRPSARLLIVPIGGGGLIGGIAAAARQICADCAIIGVEVEASCAFQTSLRAGHLVPIVPGPTLADGLGGNPDPDTITFGLIQKWVDSIVTVSELELAAALVGLIEFEHIVSEGAGAAATAAITGRRIDPGGRDAVSLVTGANIDREKLAALLQPRSIARSSAATTAAD